MQQGVISATQEYFSDINPVPKGHCQTSISLPNKNVNWVLTTYLVQWFSWLFATQERKKETCSTWTAPVMWCPEYPSGWAPLHRALRSTVFNEICQWLLGIFSREFMPAHKNCKLLSSTSRLAINQVGNDPGQFCGICLSMRALIA